MSALKTRGSWGTIKAAVSGKPAADLLALIHDLYELSPANRQFLNARFGARSSELDRYRSLIRDALWPNALGRHPNPSPSTGKRLIRDYERATGDQAGAIDLMLAFVESGTGFAADIGFDDDAFLGSLRAMLERALERSKALPPEPRSAIERRLVALRKIAGGIGSGFGDFVTDAVDGFLARGQKPISAART